jgi:hypothetical protein
VAGAWRTSSNNSSQTTAQQFSFFQPVSLLANETAIA